MQTERVTILMTPERKAHVASRAAAQGISMGEYLRRKVEDDEVVITPEQEAELQMLTAEVNRLIPDMARMLDETVATMRQSHETIDKILRDAGIR